MGLFNNNELEKKVVYLEKERSELWNRLTSMKKDYGEFKKSIKRSPVQSSKEASMYRNRTQKREEEAAEILKNILVQEEQIKENFRVIEITRENSELFLKAISDANVQAKESESSILKVTSKLDKVEEDHPNLEAEIMQLETQMAAISELNAKVTTTHKSILARKAQIDEQYYEIFGYTEENEDGEDVEIEGIKEKLSKVYDGLELKAETINETYDQRLGKVSENFDEHSIKWNEGYNTLIKKIRKLLPDALSAGLSHAYAKKREREELVLEKHAKAFSNSIGAMCLVSLIPLGISITLLLQSISFKEVLLQTPQILSAILPLYVPILWIAYASNKKANLSKRLIEEYTHKEVMNKTYEGLSSQVESLGDNEATDILRHKLLVNMLEVSGENPGKLISDYNKADHPIMDALDKSLQLTKAYEKLEKIPGLKKVANALEKKSQIEMRKKAEKVEVALASNTEDSDEVLTS